MKTITENLFLSLYECKHQLSHCQLLKTLLISKAAEGKLLPEKTNKTQRTIAKTKTEENKMPALTCTSLK